ncbi:MAG: response regulator, partial [Deltaproteobacteria bacterium]
MQLRAIERVLRDQHEVDLTVADNAIDAMIAVGALKPDLVIMDILMPGLDGIEACRRIKSNPETRDIQIVLASAMMTPELERAARHAGARRAVTKPVDLVELLGSTVAQSEPAGGGQPAPAPTIRGANLLVEMLVEAG